MGEKEMIHLLILMTDYLDKVSERGTKHLGETALIESLRSLITQGFAKITTEFKDFKKDMQNINI